MDKIKEIITTLISLLLLSLLVWKQIHPLKKCSPKQIIGMIITYGLAVYVAFVSIYLGGNWIADLMPTKIISIAMFVLVVITTLSLLQFCVGKIWYKITNGGWGS